MAAYESAKGRIVAALNEIKRRGNIKFKRDDEGPLPHASPEDIQIDKNETSTAYHNHPSHIAETLLIHSPLNVALTVVEILERYAREDIMQLEFKKSLRELYRFHLEPYQALCRHLFPKLALESQKIGKKLIMARREKIKNTLLKELRTLNNALNQGNLSQCDESHSSNGSESHSDIDTSMFTITAADTKRAGNSQICMDIYIINDIYYCMY